MGPQDHRRRSLRLKNQPYDHGSFFITICAIQREWLFGEIKDGKMELNETGNIVKKCWQDIPQHHLHVSIDTFVVMPNHLHGILHLNKTMPPRVGAQHAVPLQNESERAFHRMIPNTLGAVIRAFKSAATRRINVLRESPDERVWQRNYFERIIRNSDELHSIRTYIQSNPEHWEFDSDNL